MKNLLFLPLIVSSTAAFLVRAPPTPNDALAPHHSLLFHPHQRTPSSSSAAVTCIQRRDGTHVQSKNNADTTEEKEEITESTSDDNNDNNGDEAATSSSLFDLANPLLDLLPIPSFVHGKGDDKDNDEGDSKSDSDDKIRNQVPDSLSFDITNQWKTAEDELSSFWTRVIDTPNPISSIITEDDGSTSSSSTASSDGRAQQQERETDGDIDISASTAARSSTDKKALEVYDAKASNRDPDVVDERASVKSDSIGGVASKFLQPLEALFKPTFNTGDCNEQSDTTKANSNSNDGNLQNSLQEQATRWMGYLTSPGGGTEQSIQDMIATASESAQQDGSDVADQKSFHEVLGILRQYSAELKGTADKYFADIDMSQLRPTSLFYFIEREDEIKNPSWKRRAHRYFPGLGVERMNQLNDALTLARVGYLDSIEEVKGRLEDLTDPYELIYCDLEGEPNKPAHFLAIKQHQQPLSPSLELVLGVRGTKTITDAITDLLFEDADYRGGKVHSGMLASGKYIAEKHTPLLQELLKSSGKQRISIQLVGHSLGAGAVAIAAMEFRDEPNIDVEVVGFGSPALVSKDLSEEMKDFMTTVVADDDVVSRLSAATVINALLDVMEFDFVPSARRDIEHALEELQRQYPKIVTSERIDKVVSDFIDPLLEKHISSSIQQTTTERMEPTLFPPGEIFHLYRNGAGISGSVVPCTFFDKIDFKRNMIDDHLFHSGYERIFLDVMRLHYKDHAFQFENPVTPYDDEDVGNDNAS